MRIGGLCSGYGGLEMAVAAVTGGQVEWVCELDPHAQTVLRAHHDVPLYEDLRDVDWRRVGQVDVACAGFPCQPISQAGLRKGMDDERWIWDEVWSAVRQIEARWLYLENVPRIVTVQEGRVMEQVVRDLAEAGWSAEWGCHRADEVGACHRRDRWWCVARHPDRERSDWGVGEHGSDGWEVAAGTGGDAVRLIPTPLGRDGKDAAFGPATRTDSRLPGAIKGMLPTPTVQQGRNATSGRSKGDASEHHSGWTLNDIAYANLWDQYGPAIARHEAVLGRPAPSPIIDSPRAKSGVSLNPVFVEWMMMLPEGWVTGHGLSKTAELRLLGNGVVPRQAASAYSRLLRRFR